jgi:predicted O-linked N-acetylglucosamine transferase (SPINDLY family)
MARTLPSKKKELVVQQLLARALDLHRAGLLAPASEIYLQILEAAPRHAQARHMLGVLRAQEGRLSEALELVGAAIDAGAASAETLSDFGLILHKLGQHEEAIASFDKALAIRPDHAAALSNRGNALGKLGRHEDALASYDRALAIRPDYAEALCNRGHALLTLGRFEAALASYQRALAFRPAEGGALQGRGNALSSLGRHDEALASFEAALAAGPGSPDAHYNRANALAMLRRYEEAVLGYDKALAIRPADAAAHANRGNALLQLKRPAEALASYDRALAISPDEARTLCNRGTALKDLERHEEAIASYERALALEPRFADAHYNRASLLRELKRYDEALVAYDEARAVAPDHPDAYGIVDAAMAACDFARIAPLKDELVEAVQSGLPFTPFALLSLCDDPTLHRKCATSYIADRLKGQPTTARIHPAGAGRRERIRLAYLSADFHDHATAYLTAGLFELHDRARFELIGVSFGREDAGPMRARLVKAFDQFHGLHASGDYEACRVLQNLEIDIAVDLKGHTRGSRPELLAARPAPIQVNYLAYPGTIGCNFIDYVIADSIVLPFEQQPFYTEAIVHLPECYQVNDSTRRIADGVPDCRAAGLGDAGFVFCCFNNTQKITPPVFEIWMRLLAKMPGSVLWLLGDNASAERNLRQEAHTRGIDPLRLVFAPRVDLESHLARHRLADLFLDTLPYNAHTTASDALWASLPAVTCLGKAFAGRVGASLLHAVGLPELVTHTLEEYERLALRLASEPELLMSFRKRLACNRLSHPLFDTERFCRHIEVAYLRMWETFRSGEPPRSFAVEPIAH